MNPHMSPHMSVGKTVANWTPIFANWIQLANACQLDVSEKQTVTDQLASWQLATPANLPTELTSCFCSIIRPYPVGENSLPPSGGEENMVSSPPTRRGLPGLGGSGRKPGAAILSLDLGTRTGWALLGRDGTITGGSESFKPRRFEGGGMRYLRFKRWLTEIKQSADGLDAVYFEEVRRHAGVDAAHAYGGFMAQLTAWCEHHGIPYQGVPVGTIKKHATGKGNAGKQEMAAAMQALGFLPGDDNEADALALLMWAIATQEVPA
jgi:Holliday junction resolvasome RuvABC endonuclease subunit